MAGGDLQDLSVHKQQMVLVFTSSGTFIDAWRDAPLLTGFKEAVNSATTPLQVTLPRKFDSFDLAGATGALGSINQGNIVQYWLFGPGLPAAGKLRYQGIIDAYQPQIADTGEENVVVTLVPAGSILADHGVTGTATVGTIGGTGVDTVGHFKFFFNNNDPNTSLPWMSPLTINAATATSSGNVVSYAYINENIASVWTTILQMSPVNWFMRINADNSVVYNVPPTTAQHVFYLGQHISSVSYSQDWTGLKNVVYVTGAGTITALRKGSDTSIYGERLYLYNDTRLTDPNAVTQVAQGLLAQYDLAQTRTQIRIVDYRGDLNPGLGYDIESLMVGDTCQIINPAANAKGVEPTWNKSKWDVDFWDFVPGSQLSQIAVIVGLTYNFDYVDLEISTPQPNQDRQLFDIRRRFSDYTMAR